MSRFFRESAHFRFKSYFDLIQKNDEKDCWYLFVGSRGVCFLRLRE